MREKVREMMDKFFWNGAILTLTLEFMNLCKFLLVFVHIEKYGPIGNREYRPEYSSIAAAYIFLVLLAIPVLTINLLYKKKDEMLESPLLKDKYGRLY